MEPMINIRKAQQSEAPILTDLALWSKAYWGYTDQFMDACRQELIVAEEKIISPEFNYFVAEEYSRLVGFYAIERLSSTDFELEALFVQPGRIGTGIGKKLITHAKKIVLTKEGSSLLIQADPNTTGFYEAVGGKCIGNLESASIPGRYLPLFTLSVIEGECA